MRFNYTDGTNSDFIELCYELDAFLNGIANGEENRKKYNQYNKLDDIYDVILCYDEDIPIGCASFKMYEDSCAEVKRVFVKKDFRKKGIANELIHRIEKCAIKKGYTSLILETGRPLEAAMALYLSHGFHVIPNYGQYKDMPESICMKKELNIVQ